MKKVMEAIWGDYERGLDTVLLIVGYSLLVAILWAGVA